VKALSSSSNTEKKKSIQSGSQTLMEGLRLWNYLRRTLGKCFKI
jgi:hypothetical protein